ncbi:hypothetical protein ACOZ4N_17690 [Halorientalis pallida]|uniref:hypothetical protein n=1 Tax=Halorientalis pallida TaxID=2479928 RepID=UPI003C6F95D3
MSTLRRVKKGLRDPRLAVDFLSYKTLKFLDKNLPIGSNVFERDWDVLVVLDACRYDLFEAFAPKHDVYDSFESVTSYYSVASSTKFWVRRTFDERFSNTISKTHYVSGMGYADQLNSSRLQQLDHVWRYAELPEAGSTRPEAVTDAGVQAIRNDEAERVIIHYAQPHAPFLHCLGRYNSKAGDGGNSQNVWNGLADGQYDTDEVWRDYGQNLLRILDEVEVVIEEADGTVVVTSDHGNAMGEWGIYGHPGHIPLPTIRKVPWAEATGKAKRAYSIKGRDEFDSGRETSLHDHLKSLGYHD